MSAILNLNLDTRTLTAKAENGALKALYKASAYLMTIARRKIRYTKKSPSKPGEPPHKHSKFPVDFAKTIQFDVDRNRLSSYVGPIKKGAGIYNVPEILEHGGMSDEGRPEYWYHRYCLDLPKKVKTKMDVANWLLNDEQKGPLFAAGSVVDLAHEKYNASGPKQITRREVSKRLKANPNAGIYKWMTVGESMKGGRKHKVYMLVCTIKSWEQAAKAATNIWTWFGSPVIKPHPIAARPFMLPTLRENTNQVLNKFRNII